MCNRSIPYVTNTLKYAHLSSDLYFEFASTLYNDRSVIFHYLFRRYTKPSSKNILHPVALKEWKLNLDK